MSALLHASGIRVSSRWNANDVDAARASMLTAGAVAALAMMSFLLQRDYALVKLDDTPRIELIRVELAPNRSVEMDGRQRVEQQPQSRVGETPPDAIGTTPLDRVDVDPPAETVGTPSGSTNGDPNGTPDGTGVIQGTGAPSSTSTGTPLDVAIPDVDEFISVEREPSFSMTDLYRSIRYPDMARRAGVEGVVLVKVFVDAEGRVQRIGILDSENAMLNEAAIAGVRALRYTPAVQAGVNVGCWLRIPVQFELR